MPPECIVVDVPERLSFDAAIPVVDPNQVEAEEAETGNRVSVFHSLGRGDFPRSLRSISVSARRDTELLDVLSRIDLAGCFAS